MHRDRFGRGDFHVRDTQESLIAEFEPLAVALDDMALKLAGRKEELRIANEHLEELASLDGLTGRANRRASTASWQPNGRGRSSAASRWR